MIKRFNTQYVGLILLLICSAILLSRCTSPSKEKIVPDEKQYNVGINNEELVKIISANTKAVFLSFDKSERDFGSIMLIDLMTGKQIKILDNQFYNASPIFFEYSNVLFASARIGESNWLKMVKYHAWKQLYYLDLKKMSIRPYYSKYDSPEKEGIDQFKSILWDPNRNQIYVLDDNKYIYKISNETKESSLLFQPREETTFWEINLSPSKEYLAIKYINSKEGSGILTYDLSSDSIVSEIKNSPKVFILLGWSFSNNIYYALDGVKEFNFRSNTTKNANISLDKNHYRVKQIFPETEKSIILLVDILEKNPASRFPNTVSTEIARYNLETNEIEWITNDGAIKKDLNVLVTN